MELHSTLRRSQAAITAVLALTLLLVIGHPAVATQAALASPFTPAV